MKSKVSKAKRAPAAAGIGMLPSDEQQGGFANEESGHQTLVLRGPSKKEKVETKANSNPFSSPFGANEDKARARGYHQQSAKDASGFAPLTGGKKKAKTETAASSKPAAAPVDEDAPITRTTLIMDIVYKYPEAVETLTEAGLDRIGCQLSVYDDFQTGCAIHGFDEATIDALVVKMNEVVRAARKKG